MYQYEVLANGASCSFPKVTVEVGNPIATLPSFSSSQVSASFSTVLELVTANNLLMVAGTPATAKSIDNGSTWTDNQSNDDLNGRMTLLAGKIYSSSGLGLYSSTDAITWQRVEEGTKPSQCSGMPSDITTINGLLYGFCNNHIVASGDGRAWGLVSADLGFRGRSLIRSNNRWIMAGGAGLIKIAD
ncbi:MAG TPA: hypothetical protein PLT95_09830 [Agitococcus sp.]|nr:hypothetical protein [Agitococcus sp.]